MLLEDNNSFADLEPQTYQRKLKKNAYEGFDDDNIGEVKAKGKTDRYRRGGNSKKNLAKVDKQAKGYAEDVKESYEDVVNKNKQQVFKPAQRKL